MHEQVKEMEREVRGKSVGYIGAALGLVAGLAWNDAITTLIDALFPLAKDTVVMKLVYAALVTVLVIVVIKYLDKWANKKDNK